MLCSTFFSLVLEFLYHSQLTGEHSSGKRWVTSTCCQFYKMQYRLQYDHSIIFETLLTIMSTHDYSSPITAIGYYQILLGSIVAISQSIAIWSSDLCIMQILCCSLFRKSISSLDFCLEIIPPNRSYYPRIRGNPVTSKYNSEERIQRKHILTFLSLYFPNSTSITFSVMISHFIHLHTRKSLHQNLTITVIWFIFTKEF